MKIRPVGAELFHVDGRTDGRTDRQRQRDMAKLIVAFRNFVNFSFLTICENNVENTRNFEAEMTIL
jgi:hypothetical protein